MSKQGKSAAGRLFYTFGTIFLLTVIMVCVLNFIQDSRFVQNRAETAAAQSSSQTEAVGKQAQ
ncbi:MAG: hypothetical protein GXY17_05855 [Clostridiaceae bacterium]|jgi:hypothetical protein|nr:hypothetical protein [Clostridiaceae bacterium]